MPVTGTFGTLTYLKSSGGAISDYWVLQTNNIRTFYDMDYVPFSTALGILEGTTTTDRRSLLININPKIPVSLGYIAPIQTGYTFNNIKYDSNGRLSGGVGVWLNTYGKVAATGRPGRNVTRPQLVSNVCAVGRENTATVYQRNHFGVDFATSLTNGSAEFIVGQYTDSGITYASLDQCGRDLAGYVWFAWLSYAGQTSGISPAISLDSGHTSVTLIATSNYSTTNVVNVMQLPVGPINQPAWTPTLPYTPNWQRELVYTGETLEAVNIVRDSSNNLYCIVKNTTINRSYLIKYNSSGTLQWQRMIDNVLLTDLSISGTDLFITGTDTSNRIYIAKYNDSGVIQFQNVFADSAGTLASVGIFKLTTFIYVAGNITISGNTYGIAIKLPADGTIPGLGTYGTKSYAIASNTEGAGNLTDQAGSATVNYQAVGTNTNSTYTSSGVAEPITVQQLI